MGWTVYYRQNSPRTYAAEKAEILNLFSVTDAAAAKGISMDVLQASKVDSTWYVAVKVTGRGDSAAPYVTDADGTYVAAAVILTSRKNGEWGYKDMTETMGPRESKAPATLLAKLSPLRDGDGNGAFARRWRADCEEYANRVKPKHGDRIKLAEPVTFPRLKGQSVKVTEVECTYYMRRGKKLTCYRHPDVGLLRLRPDHLRGATII